MCRVALRCDAVQSIDLYMYAPPRRSNWLPDYFNCEDMPNTGVEPYQLSHRFRSTQNTKWTLSTSCHAKCLRNCTYRRFHHGAHAIDMYEICKPSDRAFNCQATCWSKRLTCTKSQVTMTTAPGKVHNRYSQFQWLTFHIGVIQIWMSNMVRCLWIHFVECAVCSAILPFEFIVFASFFSAVVEDSYNRWIWNFDTSFCFVFRIHSYCIVSTLMHDWLNAPQIQWTISLYIETKCLCSQISHRFIFGFISQKYSNWFNAIISQFACVWSQRIQMSPEKF